MWSHTQAWHFCSPFFTPSCFSFSFSFSFFPLFARSAATLLFICALSNHKNCSAISVGLGPKGWINDVKGGMAGKLDVGTFHKGEGRNVATS